MSMKPSPNYGFSSITHIGLAFQNCTLFSLLSRFQGISEEDEIWILTRTVTKKKYISVFI